MQRFVEYVVVGCVLDLHVQFVAQSLCDDAERSSDEFLIKIIVVTLHVKCLAPSWRTLASVSYFVPAYQQCADMQLTHSCVIVVTAYVATRSCSVS